MNEFSWVITSILFFSDLAIRVGLSLRVIMRKRAASVSLAWLAVILLLPFIGAIIYLMFGENRLGERRAKRAAANLIVFRKWSRRIKRIANVDWDRINPECEPIHRQIDNVFSIPALQDNELQLIDTSDLFFDNLIQDIRLARSHCYLQFYIMSEGGRVDEVVEELIKIADRGIICRVMLDSIGSKKFLAGKVPDRMRRAGIEVVEVLPAGIFRYLFVRVDLRNHRKVVIVDNKVAYTGSQNLVDPRFFKQDSGVGEWKDTMVRIRGPLIEAMTAAFLYDWVLETEDSPEDLTENHDLHRPSPAGKAVVQMLPSGPGFRENAIHDLLLTTIYAARREIILTTPYFVPDNAILTALANDHGYPEVFRRQLEVSFNKNDLLVAISASGNSENVLRAVDLANQRGGVTVGLALGVLVGHLQRRWPWVATLPRPLNWGEPLSRVLGALLWQVYRGTARLVAFFTRLLEGEGGVLWAIVLLSLLAIWMLGGRP